MTDQAFDARLLVVGGHTRNIGKTSLVVDLIRAFPEARWTAAKITQCGHGVCSAHDEPCGCAPREYAFSLDEETDRGNHSDTSRFLAAGATRSLWLRCKQGRLPDGLPHLRRALCQTEYAVIESNSLLQFLRPTLYLMVLDPRRDDFKGSALRYRDLCDAYILRGETLGDSTVASDALPAAKWFSGFLQQMVGRPLYAQPLGAPLPAEFVEFVRRHFFGPQWISRPSVWHDPS